jgi:glucose-1-phosphate cytidylyltransferase
MKVALLAGGLGTRLREETEFRPKPMVPIGGRPILWHIMKTYAHYSHQCSVLTTHGALEEAGWSVTVVDTGAETMTGGRLYRVRDHVNNETFMCTYGDGVADVDVRDLVAFHKSHGKIATMTAVKPVSRFGVLDISENDHVEHFREKPQADGWVNAGYFVFEPRVFDYLDEDCVLEKEPLTNLARDHQLVAYKHGGFWQPMDTYRETMILNEMWTNNTAPWKVW